MNTTKLIFLDLGHLQLFYKADRGNEVYYIDKRFPVEIGPFISNADAIGHWKSIAPSGGSMYQKESLDFIEPVLPPSNVIHVDFVMKRRIK